MPLPWPCLERIPLKNKPPLAVHVQKCATANFCKRNRGVSGTSYVVDGSSVKVADATLTATLTNTASKAQFSLVVKSYGGIVRLLVDEPSGSRYQIPDILEPTVDSLLTPWSDAKSTRSSWSGVSGPAAVTLSFSPFKLDVSVGGVPALSVNSRAMFQVEHARAKQVSR